jgi:uncharacterized protein (TIGR02687 family)
MTIEEIKNELVKIFASPVQQYHKRKIVFWEDPEKEFSDSVSDLSLKGVNIICLSSKNLFMAKQAVNNEEAGDLLIYDPTNTDPKDDWLQDARLYADAIKHFDFYSMVMSRVGILETRQMRDVVKGYKRFWQSDERIKKFVSICPSAQTPAQVHLSVLATLLGSKTSAPTDILFHLFAGGLVASENAGLKAVESFGSLGNLWKVVGKYAGDTHENLENALNTILLTALYGTMGSSVPSKVTGYVYQPALSECQALVAEWTHNSNYSEESSSWICDAETRLGLASLFDGLTVEELMTSDLFPSIDGAILKKAFDAVANGGMSGGKAMALVGERRVRSWYGRYSNYFECLYSMGQLLHDKDAVGESFNYISGEELWADYSNRLSSIDSDYRHIHYFYYKTTFDSLGNIQDKLSMALDYLEGLYKNWFLNGLNDSWVKLVKDDLSKNGMVSYKIPLATDFFDKFIDSKLGDKITFVVISDGMRFEVAKELKDRLASSTKGDVEISTMEAVFPAITKYGMPALLPGKKTVGADYEVMVNGQVADTLSKRKAVLHSRVAESDAVSYSDLANMKTADLKEFVKDKKVVYVYHNDIDGTGHDSAGESKVFEACEDSIQKIIGLVKKICGVRASCRIVITSDHGFIYTYQKLNEAEKLSIKNDEIVDASGEKRCIVAKNEISSDFLLQVKMLVNNEAGSLVGYAPYQTIRLKAAGGSSNYVHGGVSLEEMMVPVVEFDSVRSDSKAYASNKDKYEHKPVGIKLTTPLSKPICTNVFAFDFYQDKSVGLDAAAAKYQIFLEDVKGSKISDIGNVIADKTDPDAAKRTFSVMLNLKPGKYLKSDIYYLTVMDVESGAILSKDQVVIDGDFSDDFGF